MTGHSSPDWNKLGRYLAGESSPDEAAAVRRWLEENRSDAQLVAELDAAAVRAASHRPLDVEAALLRVKTRAKATARTALRRFAGFAAAAAILMIAGVIATGRLSDNRDETASIRTYSTAIGQRDSVVLADGSRIILGPASRAVVRDNEVQLTGEAFFDIVHNPSRPFTVRAGDVIVRDVGTEFSVHTDPTAPVRVVVREGAVLLRRGTDSVTLLAGDVGVVEPTGRVEASRGAASPDDLAWTTGRLVFRNASIAELAADLRRWYGVELRVTDSALLRRHFTGSFAGEPANRVLDVIALALGAQVERRGDTAYVRVASPSR